MNIKQIDNQENKSLCSEERYINSPSQNLQIQTKLDFSPSQNASKINYGKILAITDDQRILTKKKTHRSFSDIVSPEHIRTFIAEISLEKELEKNENKSLYTMSSKLEKSK